MPAPLDPVDRFEYYLKQNSEQTLRALVGAVEIKPVKALDAITLGATSFGEATLVC